MCRIGRKEHGHDGAPRVCRRERYSLADRLALGRRTLLVNIRRDFAAPAIFLPIFFIAYVIGVPLLVGTSVASLAATMFSGRLGAWLIAQFQLRRARSGLDDELRNVPDEGPSGGSLTVNHGDSREINSAASP